MPIRKNDHPMDERLAELERELRQVRKNLRAVEKGHGTSPRFPEPTAAGEQPDPTPPRNASDARHGELFAYASGGTRPGHAQPRDVDDKRRFAHYFASGSFVGGMRPMREVRRVQRNKAIFMVIIVLVVAFILFSIFR